MKEDQSQKIQQREFRVLEDADRKLPIPERSLFFSRWKEPQAKGDVRG